MVRPLLLALLLPLVGLPGPRVLAQTDIVETSLSAPTVVLDDQIEVMSPDQYLAMVDEHHPLANVANLQSERARAYQLMARGGFDPKLYGDLNQKYFDGSNYYSLLNGGVKIPTWYGVELQAGYENNGGIFLDPEATVPDAGLFNAGVALNLGRGLAFDERRAELQRAEVFADATEAERDLFRNELFLDASEAYWKWFQAWYEREIYRDAVAAAEQRYEAVFRGAEVGDRPAIDTLEAKIQVQNRQIELNDAELYLANARINLSVYLWIDGRVPLELDPSVRPVDLGAYAGAGGIPNIPPNVENHPELRLARTKLEQLRIDNRLAREDLKPEVQLKYNALSGQGKDREDRLWYSNDYKWGVSVNTPLLFRKERGKRRLTELKLETASYEFLDKQAQLNYKLLSALNQIGTLEQQLELIESAVENYRQLLEGERRLFRLGESSLFLVNSREVKYIDARRKFVATVGKRQLARATAAYAAGRSIIDYPNK